MFQEKKIDIVLLDLKMPKKGGIETLHEMRKITDDFEAIILTGYSDETSAIQAMRDGAINILQKSDDTEKTISEIKKAIEKLCSERSLKYRNRK